MSGVPIAFYAPLKDPDHPQPSGDRAMARLLIRALQEGGFAPEIASRVRTFEPNGNEAAQRRLHHDSLLEADRLTACCATLPAEVRPRLWFTYHSYYKAPDHLGPEMSRRLGVPYCVAEASRAGKRAQGGWTYAHRAVEAGLDSAAALFVLTRRDREALERGRLAGQQLVDLPPFLDASLWCGSQETSRGQGRGPTRLLTVAMMRAGDKLESYRLLAAALNQIASLDWTLGIVGDGPARAEVAELFRPFGQRVTFAGQVDGAELVRAYAGADLFVWPAVNEAYGMALLEAQGSGCPVIAGGFGGVPDAMRPGITGCMPAPGDAAAFAAEIADLIGDPARRDRMGAAARAFVQRERDIGSASRILHTALHAQLARARRR